jgi:hypothetical protein
VGIGGTISGENIVGMERKYLICGEYLIMWEYLETGKYLGIEDCPLSSKGQNSGISDTYLSIRNI